MSEGRDLPLGRCLLAHPGFQSSRLHQSGLWAPNWHGAAGDAGKETGLSSHAVPWPRLQAGGTRCSPHPAARHLLGWIYRATQPREPRGPTAQGCTMSGHLKNLHCWGTQHWGTHDRQRRGAEGPVSTRVPRGPAALRGAASGHPGLSSPTALRSPRGGGGRGGSRQPLPK